MILVRWDGVCAQWAEYSGIPNKAFYLAVVKFGGTTEACTSTRASPTRHSTSPPSSLTTRTRSEDMCESGAHVCVLVMSGP